ncbi:FimV/HubP family polar landmark protein [Paraferrimonas haliotis]|nr:FimV/HubP family polar landmark protein [Paraferrimonas haliotis]
MKLKGFRQIGLLVLLACSSVASTSFAQAPVETSTSSLQTAEQYGPTTPRDTLWGIANKVQPESGVSIYQVMVALFDANPHAFTSRNLNSLEKGVIMLVPRVADIAAYPAEEAKARAERDDKNWNKPQPIQDIEPTAADMDAVVPEAPVADDNEAVNAQQQQLDEQLSEISTSTLNPIDESIDTDISETLAEQEVMPSAEVEEALDQIVQESEDMVRNSEELENTQQINRSLTQEVSSLRGQLGAMEAELEVSRETAAGLRSELQQSQTVNAQLKADLNRIGSSSDVGFLDALLTLWWLILLVAILPVAIVALLGYRWYQSNQQEALAPQMLHEAEHQQSEQAQTEQPQQPHFEPESSVVASAAVSNDASEAELAQASSAEAPIAVLADELNDETTSEAVADIDSAEKEAMDSLWAEAIDNHDEQNADNDLKTEASVIETEDASELSDDIDKALADFESIDLDSELDNELDSDEDLDKVDESANDTGLEWSLDESLLAGVDSTDAERPQSTQAPQTDSNALEFDLSDLSLEDTDVKSEQETETAQPFIEIDELMLEAADSTVDADPYQDPNVDLTEVEEVVNASKDVDVDDAENSVNAKLDLARAYIEIQDTDSAKALLKDVTLDGNDEQKMEATRLLRSLA